MKSILLWTWFKYLWDLAFSSFKYIPRSGIAGLYGKFIFNSLRYCHTIFHSGCTISHSNQQGTEVLIFFHIFTNTFFFLFSFVLIVAILMNVRWLSHSFDVHSPNDTEYLFMGLLAICISSLKKCLVFCTSLKASLWTKLVEVMDSSWAISNPERWWCESAAVNMPANLENFPVATGLEKVSFHSNPKERQCQRMLKLLQNCTHLTC